MDWTTSISDHFNQQMLYASTTPDTISGSVMIDGLMIIRISSAHYTTGIFSNVYSSFWLISHFRCTSVLNWYTLQPGNIAEYKARWTWPIGGRIHKISFLPERRFCQLFVHPTRPTSPIFRATSRPGPCISRLVIFERIPTTHLESAPGFSLGLSPVPRKIRKMLTRHGIPRLEQCCPHSETFT